MPCVAVHRVAGLVSRRGSGLCSRGKQFLPAKSEILSGLQRRFIAMASRRGSGHLLEEKKGGEMSGNLRNASSNSSVAELRAHLYLEQQRWNHFWQDPDEKMSIKLRKIVDLIRKIL